MLVQLFGSKTRVKLLQLLLDNPTKTYYLRELARQLKNQLNAVRREINNLESLGIVKSVDFTNPDIKNSKIVKSGSAGTSAKYFSINTDFILYSELKALFLKAQLMIEKDFVKQVEKMPKVKLLLLTGIFVGLANMSTDILIVGSIDKKRIASLVKSFQRDISHEINYTIMSSQEFKYRKDITDKFLYDILEGKKIVIIDRSNEK